MLPCAEFFNVTTAFKHYRRISFRIESFTFQTSSKPMWSERLYFQVSTSPVARYWTLEDNRSPEVYNVVEKQKSSFHQF